MLGFPVPGVHGTAPHRGNAGVPRAALRPGDLRGPRWFKDVGFGCFDFKGKCWVCFALKLQTREVNLKKAGTPQSS